MATAAAAAVASTASSAACANFATSFLVDSFPLKHASTTTSPVRQHHHYGLRIEASKKGGRGPTMGGRTQQTPQQPPSLPQSEDDNPRFVIFIRSKNVPFFWYPVSVISGGTSAKLLVGATKNEWGNKLYGNSLTRNIGLALYKDEKAILTSVSKKVPTLKAAKAFEFGYKLVDETNLAEGFKPVDIVVIPPKEELKSMVDKMKESVGGVVEGVKETFGMKTQDKSES